MTRSRCETYPSLICCTNHWLAERILREPRKFLQANIEIISLSKRINSSRKTQRNDFLNAILFLILADYPLKLHCHVSLPFDMPPFGLVNSRTQSTMITPDGPCGMPLGKTIKNQKRKYGQYEKRELPFKIKRSYVCFLAFATFFLGHKAPVCGWLPLFLFSFSNFSTRSLELFDRAQLENGWFLELCAQTSAC